ncbi:hypothetical protein ACGFYM_39755 [Streptomyces sp. NPDC048231]|uniref:hypothetical protein n=1 Tax=Streptomyces sp. NPDC048231 TaxID=3365519 RepID=UPI0037187AEF
MQLIECLLEGAAMAGFVRGGVAEVAGGGGVTDGGGSGGEPRVQVGGLVVA